MDKKTTKVKHWICPVCDNISGRGTFVCVQCRQWVHPKCGGYTTMFIQKNTDYSILECNNCKAPSDESDMDYEPDSKVSPDSDRDSSSDFDNHESSKTNTHNDGSSSGIDNGESSKTNNDGSSSNVDDPDINPAINEDSSESEFHLIFNGRVVMSATLVPSKPGDLVHNHPIEQDESKFLISKVFCTDWDEYDADIHCPGTFLRWLSSESRKVLDDKNVMYQSKSRKRKVNKLNWKSVKAKQARAHGTKYLSRYGKTIPAKKVNTGDLCGEKCRLKCSQRLTVPLREELFNTYYSLDQAGKHQFLFACMEGYKPIQKKNAKGLVFAISSLFVKRDLLSADLLY